MRNVFVEDLISGTMVFAVVLGTLFLMARG